jgi:hypothetical protein
MSTRIITVAFGMLVLVQCAVTQESPPILKESPERLLALMSTTGTATFAAACLNVTRDAKLRRLRIFATTATATTGTFNEADWEIEVIFNAEVLAKPAAGPYHQHNNHLILKLAAAQFTASQKELGLRLVRLLAEASPNMWWSSSTVSRHPTLTIQQILEGLEKNDEAIQQFLKEESEDWAYRLEAYSR